MVGDTRPMDATANKAIIVLRNITILRHRFIAPSQGRALEVGIVLENRYQLRRLRYSTLREPRLIKFKFSERVNDSQAAAPTRCSPLRPMVVKACNDPIMICRYPSGTLGIQQWIVATWSI
jgi:hypothetical protein